MSDLRQRPTHRNDYDDKSLAGLLAEIGRLLLLLLLKGLTRVWKHVRKGLRFLLKYVCKALLWLIDQGIYCARQWNRFWNDRSTQEKVRRLKEVARTCWQGLVTSARWTARNSVKAAHWLAVNGVKGGRWLAVHLWQWGCWLGIHLVQWAWLFCKGVGWTIVHLRHAAGVAWKGLCTAAAWLWLQLKRLAAAIRRFYRRQKAAGLHFRRRGGVKGMLIRWGLSLKQSIYNSMEEQDTSTAAREHEEAEEEEPEEALEDEEEALFKRVEQSGSGKVHTYGRGFYQALKRIVEDE